MSRVVKPLGLWVTGETCTAAVVACPTPNLARRVRETSFRFASSSRLMKLTSCYDAVEGQDTATDQRRSFVTPASADGMVAGLGWAGLAGKA